MTELSKLENAVLTLIEVVASQKSALNYVANNTCINLDGNWEFKPNYDPQIVLDALEL